MHTYTHPNWHVQLQPVHVCWCIETHRSHPLPRQQGGCMTCHFLLYLQRQRPPQPQDTHTHTHPWPFTSVGPVFSLGYECVLNGFQLFMTHVDWGPPGSSVHGIFQARILAGVGCHFLHQGIFLTQGSNLLLLCLLHCRRILDHLNHWENLPLGCCCCC